MHRFLIAACAALLVFASPAAARPGDLDRSFAGGRVVIDPTAQYGRGGDIARSGSGAIAVGVIAQDAPAFGQNVAFARLTATGRIVQQVPLRISTARQATVGDSPAVVALPGGDSVVAGTVSGYLRAASPNEWVRAVYVAHVTAAGALDPRFGVNGVSLLIPPEGVSFVWSSGPIGLGVDAAGRTLVLYATSVGQGSSLTVARLLPDGAPDPGYGNGGFAVASNGLVPGALLVGRDGSATVAGFGPRRIAVLGLDAQGRVRPGYGTSLSDASVVDPVSLAAGPAHTILLAGNDRRGSRLSGWVARLGAGGRVDRRFGSHGRATPGGTSSRLSFSAMARDRRGRIVLAGFHRNSDGDNQAAIVRLTPSGRLDRRFGIVVKQIGVVRNASLVASEANGVAVDAHDRILVAGTAEDNGVVVREDLGHTYFAVARLKG
jgi:uncharacterized delta-60 repeat protein